MCIDCARRKLRRLRQEHPLGGRNQPDEWLVCIVDHEDHVHVRINGVEGSMSPSDWVQIPAPMEVFQQALDETGIPHRLHLHESSPAAPKGCSAELIGSIPHVVFNADAAAAASVEEEVCAVCYEPFRSGDEVALLPCAHRYHAACVGPWLAKATTCPACREEITEEAVAQSATLPGALASLERVAPPPPATTSYRVHGEHASVHTSDDASVALGALPWEADALADAPAAGGNAAAAGNVGGGGMRLPTSGGGPEVQRVAAAPPRRWKRLRRLAACFRPSHGEGEGSTDE